MEAEAGDRNVVATSNGLGGSAIRNQSPESAKVLVTGQAKMIFWNKIYNNDRFICLVISFKHNANY
ncbi:hypothetical protein [Fimbriiglobus ruber]|uniref:hypothetical protein n=1 Tax=Fimbriiglobus ruber TaxID=1908690 RepID=UPI00117B8633|nr:hypothetical protein [Fimbriiglobus ruber]